MADDGDGRGVLLADLSVPGACVCRGAAAGVVVHVDGCDVAVHLARHQPTLERSLAAAVLAGDDAAAAALCDLLGERLRRGSPDPVYVWDNGADYYGCLSFSAAPASLPVADVLRLLRAVTTGRQDGYVVGVIHAGELGDRILPLHTDLRPSYFLHHPSTGRAPDPAVLGACTPALMAYLAAGWRGEAAKPGQDSRRLDGREEVEAEARRRGILGGDTP